MLYIVLGKSHYPISNQLFTEHEIENMKNLQQANEWTFVPIELPWAATTWAKSGGKGHSAYPECEYQQMIRVPKTLAYEVKKYAVWLHQNQKPR